MNIRCQTDVYVFWTMIRLGSIKYSNRTREAKSLLFSSFSFLTSVQSSFTFPQTSFYRRVTILYYIPSLSLCFSFSFAVSPRFPLFLFTHLARLVLLFPESGVAYISFFQDSYPPFSPLLPSFPLFPSPFPFPVFACCKKSSCCNSLILMLVVINPHNSHKKVVKKFGKGVIVGLSLQPQSGRTVLYGWCRWRAGTFWYRGITDCKSSYQWLTKTGSIKNFKNSSRKIWKIK